MIAGEHVIGALHKKQRQGPDGLALDGKLLPWDSHRLAGAGLGRHRWHSRDTAALTLWLFNRCDQPPTVLHYSTPAQLGQLPVRAVLLCGSWVSMCSQKIVCKAQ